MLFIQSILNHKASIIYKEEMVDMRDFNILESLIFK